MSVSSSLKSQDMSLRREALTLLLGGPFVFACQGAMPYAELDVSLEVGPEVVVVGTMDDSGHIFGSISAVVVRNDGSVLVADRTASQIVHLSPAGEILAVAGGPGEGPGEFYRPVAIALVGVDEYLVIDSEAFEATLMRVEDATHSFVRRLDLGYQTLHACGRDEDVVFDPYFGEAALAHLGAEGGATGWFGDLLDVPDAGLSPRSVEGLRARFGSGYPLCGPEGVVFVPEWGNMIEGFSWKGEQRWSVQITPHNTFAWEVGAEGRAEVRLPDSGWFHRAVGGVIVDRDLVLVQYQELHEDVGARDKPPTEIRFVRPSDGSQAAVEAEMPVIAHLGEGFAWGWRNLPFPQVVKFELRVVGG